MPSLTWESFMERISEKDLENVVLRINRAAGTPLTYATSIGNDRVINIGHYHLDFAYGGVKLVQTMNHGGGIRNITTSGYGTKRELYHQLHAYLAGIEDCVRSSAQHDDAVKSIVNA